MEWGIPSSAADAGDAAREVSVDALEVLDFSFALAKDLKMEELSRFRAGTALAGAREVAFVSGLTSCRDGGRLVEALLSAAGGGASAGFFVVGCGFAAGVVTAAGMGTGGCRFVRRFILH